MVHQTGNVIDHHQAQTMSRLQAGVKQRKFVVLAGIDPAEVAK